MRWLLLLFFFASCQRDTLSVYTEYLSFRTLPSYIMNTPDPMLYCPDFGEKLHITWSVSKKCSIEALLLRIDLRYGNGTFDRQEVELDTPNGIYVLPLLNEEYREKDGIFTYKLTLYGDGCPIKEERHLLWVDPITLE